jgi:flagellar protein FlgJ
MDALLGTIDQSVSNVGAARAAQASSRSFQGNGDKASEAAKDFEAVFLSQMLTHMFDGVETNEMFGGGHAEQIYKSMMIEEYGKLISANGGIGLSNAVKAEMIAMQEQQTSGAR